MEYDEFQRHIGKAGLKLQEFASLMQMTPTSLSNYRKKGGVPMHLAVIAVLLGEMADHGIDFHSALSVIKIASKKSRGIVFKGKSATEEDG